ncbi:MAG TPA: radical SAM protein, partial [Longimicrobiaceae bacterium]
MILLVNPRATRPKNRRFPLSVMNVGAALPEGTQWEIIDGNRPTVDPLATITRQVLERRFSPDPVRVVAFSVMPGPQLVSAVPLTREVKRRFPELAVVWGGNFPSLYPHPVIAAPYVDFAVRGQGEHAFRELLEVLDGGRDPKTVAGLMYRDENGEHRINLERPWVGPDELPDPPYHKIPIDDYLLPTWLGRRTGVYQQSIGCPFGCKFCGVISVFGSREKQQRPERTARHLEWLVKNHGMDAVHFYDNNFFLKEDHAMEIAERLAPLGISWWCEARIDLMLRLSDACWRALRKSGLKMVFYGAESGSDEVLKKMNKTLTVAQTEEIAAKTREHGIVPEFSFVLGGPDDPAAEIDTTLAFIRKLKAINPSMELITYFYTPTPQRRGTYGNVDALAGTPDTLEEWMEPEWVRWSTHEDPRVPWMNGGLRTRVENFRLVPDSRFPSLHDRRTKEWG